MIKRSQNGYFCTSPPISSAFHRRYASTTHRLASAIRYLCTRAQLDDGLSVFPYLDDVSTSQQSYQHFRNLTTRHRIFKFSLFLSFFHSFFHRNPIPWSKHVITPPTLLYFVPPVYETPKWDRNEVGGNQSKMSHLWLRHMQRDTAALSEFTPRSYPPSHGGEYIALCRPRRRLSPTSIKEHMTRSGSGTVRRLLVLLCSPVRAFVRLIQIVRI